MVLNLLTSKSLGFKNVDTTQAAEGLAPLLGLYDDHLFGQAQFGYNLLCKALRKHKLITGDSLMTDYQSPVSSSLVTLKEREQHSRRQWSSYQLNS